VGSWPSLLNVVHLVGLAMGAGSATVKLMLLMMCGADPSLVPVFLRVARPITRLIIAGTVLLTLSGIGWMLLGYGFTTLLVVKIVLVAAIWVLGPVIDNVIEPGYRKLAPTSGTSPTPEFLSMQRRYVAWEAIATLLFYVIVVMWVLR